MGNEETEEIGAGALVNVQASHSQAYEFAKELNFIAGLVLGEAFEFAFPETYVQIYNYLKTLLHERKSFKKFALGLPRGFAKTTLMKLVVLHSILYSHRKVHLFVYETLPHAENFIADVCDMLSDPNIIAIFGDWRAGILKDTQKEKKFSFRGRVVFLKALGVLGSVRGLNLGNDRPEFMLMEDIQSREVADSKEQTRAIESWMIGTLFKAKSPHGCLYLFVANMYPTPHSLLRKLKINPEWTKLIVGGILADGTSLWEDLHPIATLQAEYRSDLAAGHPEIFAAEVLNDENLLVNKRIDLTLVPDYTYPEDDIPAGSYIIIDPATDKMNADAVSIGYFEVHDGKNCLMEIREGRFNPAETIRISLEMALRKGCPLICPEANAYQYSLMFWFQKIMLESRITGIQVQPVYSGTYSKDSRILKMFPDLEKGELLLHNDVRMQVFDQAANYIPGKHDNTDGLLDLLCYAPKVVELYGGLIFGRLISATQTSIGVWENTSF